MKSKFKNVTATIGGQDFDELDEITVTKKDVEEFMQSISKEMIPIDIEDNNK